MIDKIMERLNRLAGQGITVSFAYGPNSNFEVMWSVMVIRMNGDTFDAPYAALDLEHAAYIAEMECEKRGWIPEAIT